MAKGELTWSKQLRNVRIGLWLAAGHSGLTDARDLRGAQTLAAIADAAAEDGPARALDVLVMRLTAIQRA
eukprot:296351-Lingulodinium_polyedra.AAC.1